MKMSRKQRSNSFSIAVCIQNGITMHAMNLLESSIRSKHSGQCIQRLDSTETLLRKVYFLNESVCIDLPLKHFR